MNRKQKLSNFLVIALCIILASGNVYATPAIDNLEAINLKLVEIGVPIESINKMDIEKKKDIIENTIKYISSETTYYDEDGNIIDIIPGKISPMGTIPTASFSLTIDVFRAANSSDNRERFTIYSNYEWLNIPPLTQKDPFGIAWDNSRWRAVDNSTLQVVQWKPYNGSSGSWSDDSIAYSANTGVGWNAELVRSNGNGPLQKLYGYGRVQIESQTSGSISGSDQIHTNYAHVTSFVGSIGLSFKVVSVSYDGSANADTRGTYKSFNY